MISHDARTLAEWLTSLFQSKYTGRTTLHWVNGVPKKVEYPGESVPLSTPPPAADPKSS